MEEAEKRPFHVGHLLAMACFFAYITAPGLGIPRSMQNCYGPGHDHLQLHVWHRLSSIKDKVAMHTTAVTTDAITALTPVAPALRSFDSPALRRPAQPDRDPGTLKREPATTPRSNSETKH